MMYGRPVYARANFIIPSLASEPLNPKVTLSHNFQEQCHIIFDNRTNGS